MISNCDEWLNLTNRDNSIRVIYAYTCSLVGCYICSAFTLAFGIYATLFVEYYARSTLNRICIQLRYIVFECIVNSYANLILRGVTCTRLK